MLPGILAASLQEPLDRDWVRQIIKHGNSLGIPMADVYNLKRKVAIQAREVDIPTFAILMHGVPDSELEVVVDEENSMGSLFG